MSDTPTARYRLRSDVRVRLVGDEAIVLVQERAIVFGLNPVGARVLDLLRVGQPVAELVDEVRRDFDAGGADVAGDVASFVEELVSIGAVEALPAGKGGATP